MRIGVTVIFSTLLYSASYTNGLSQLESLSAYALFGLLERAKIAAFSTDSFARSGLDQNAVSHWNDLTYGCNQLVLRSIQKKDILIFSRYLFDLDESRRYILETIDMLHHHKPISSASIAQGQKHLLSMSTLETSAFEAIGTSKPSSDWTGAIPGGSILSTKHAALLEGYIQIKKIAEHDGYPINERELQGLLKLNGINDKYAIEDCINNLEQYWYKKKKHHPYAYALIKELKALFPGIISKLEMDLLAHTKDRAHVIIFTQAGAYENILHQILRELTS